ncbi:peptide-methionine (S)-S-oxide reductase [Thalassospira sp. MBR-102]|jgi:peptide-methionine (S)-S-oxide reductase|uniref:Peptide methionine sulfoxide reductase MsrA n=1 Tax=Thalassospira xiamenensis TaxID=220697 RepID=A0ABR5XXH7_9PROT|nr:MULTISPECIES: peptide-methionine (S)-S-oxide reductase MsrA [Thalassospira]MBR9781442.1 peptide-methionine (S)-S-oxide reductase MsrA [Rhodospirillales bacterium]KZC97120.1 peptide-methionine (S)-S-oxide reductase [Thalassospira xiamenensis]KZD08008.1 peptide-methionine (S)-S-oxide reductase [Thalassospira xiamenensis]MAB31936.1 peptide-methionine (S)-S-oxide reductase MsrA [Thalassospira sp.]MBL4843708.1 peptide-methionine (S)-S-oxide reductase MsrA [Thalassospira sp.]|tara:strand:- start:5158 stop:5802 length:645 start_codon:yes stop_codon:yes gene_type:complete
MFSSIAPEKVSIPSAETALPGRAEKLQVADRHAVTGNPMTGPFPDNLETAVFGMGCFWGAERLFWKQDGVFTTAAGYAGGHTENPTYREVCSGMTGHAEVVQIVFDPTVISYQALLRLFWENHDPTQGMRQGNDIGTQYRSVIYTLNDTQKEAAETSRKQYLDALKSAGRNAITTEIKDAPPFFYAEDFHQQYLHKNPDGYCGLGGTGISCPGL